MSTQPEALRLADALDDEFTQGRISNDTGRKSAAELRRLHEVNQELLEVVKEANAELEYLNDPKGFVSMRQMRIMEKLAQPSPRQQERNHEHRSYEDGSGGVGIVG